MKKQLFIPALLSLATHCALGDTYAVPDTNVTLTYTSANGAVTISDCNTDATGDLIIPDTIADSPVTSIGNRAFYDCSGLTSITIPESVDRIVNVAFSKCHSLTSITIPAAVTYIGDHAFYDCNNLATIVVAEDNPSFSSYEGALFNKDGTTLIQAPSNISADFMIPDGVTTLGLRALAYCNNLTEIYIPASVTSIDSLAFYDALNLSSFVVDDENPAFSDYEGIIFNKDQTTLAHAPRAFSGSFIVPDGVQTIGENAFIKSRSLTSVTLPEGLIQISKHAFDSCSNLTHINFPEGLISIGDSAFFGCTQLTSITIPKSLDIVGHGAFQYSDRLANATFMGDVPTSFQNSVFNGTSSKFKIAYPASAEGWTTPTWNGYAASFFLEFGWNFVPQLGWTYGYSDHVGYSMAFGAIYTAEFPFIYLFNHDFGWLFYVASLENNNHYLHNESLGWIFINTDSGGWFQYSNNVWAWDNFTAPQP